MEPFDLRLWKGFAVSGGDASKPAVVDQIAIDSRRIDSPFSLFIPLEGKVHDGHRFIPQAGHSGARYTLAKKGWRPNEPLVHTTILYVDNTLHAFQEIAAAYRKQRRCKVVAIAGSFGKTMVKDLLQDMLSLKYSVVASPESFNSQIGVPLSLLTIKDEHELALIEAAISQKGEMDALTQMIGADYGIVTHIGKKHSITLGDLATASQEIFKLFRGLPKEHWIIAPEVPCVIPVIEQIGSAHHFWTNKAGIYPLPHATFVSQEHGSEMHYAVDFPDGKKHYGTITSGFYYFMDLINITAKAAWLFGIDSDSIKIVLSKHQPEPTRTEIWKSPLGSTFINDTYCSDPQSIDKAMHYFRQASKSDRKSFIFGGIRGKTMHSNSDYRYIGKAIHNAGVELLLLYGPHDFGALIHSIESLSDRVKIVHCRDYPEALQTMQKHIQPNDIVLVKGEKKQPIDMLTAVFNDSICSNQCIINLAAIAENLTMIRHRLQNPDTRVMVMVKALAYGTDEVRMAQFLESCGVDTLGVSYVEEGVVLKRAGITQSIFVINAAIYEAAKVVKWDLEIGVSDRLLIEAIAAEAALQNKKVKLHLHIDTGMGRFGCRPEMAIELAKLIDSSSALEFEGVMSHFACADDPEQDSFTFKQIEIFDQVIAALTAANLAPKWRHIANSSGAIRFYLPQYNMVRIGLAVYGLSSSKAVQQALELRLALSLVSRIVGINRCKYGESVSYGRSYNVEREEQNIAVLPIGYFDGLHRNYSGKSCVIIRGKKAPMVGKICMDFMMVDVTDIPNAIPGDAVLIFGEDEYGHYLSPEDLATRGDSIIHELITCLGPRIQRIFVHEETQLKRL